MLHRKTRSTAADVWPADRSGLNRSAAGVLLLIGLLVNPALPAAEKLFDFGDLNVDLSKVQAKPDARAYTTATPIKAEPTQQLPSTPESPAPAVLPRDGQEAIAETVKAQAIGPGHQGRAGGGSGGERRAAIGRLPSARGSPGHRGQPIFNNSRREFL